MSFALFVNADGNLEQINIGDTLNVDIIDVAGTGNLAIGNSLGVGDELVLGNSGGTSGTGDVRVYADLYVDNDLFVTGSATVTVDETVTGVFSANGNVNLGNNSGDTINLGGGTSDILNANTTLDMNGNPITAQDYTEVSPTALAAQANDYDPASFGTADILRQDLTGSQSITGFAAPGAGDNERFVVVNIDGATDQLTLVNESASSAAANRIAGPDGNDVVLDPGECAMLTYDSTSSRWRVIALSQAATGGADTLQTAYAAGNTISVNTTDGPIAFSNSTDATDVLDVTRTFVGAGIGIDVQMGPGNEAVTGVGVSITSGTGATGDMLFVNNLGSGDAIDVQDGGNSVFTIDGNGGVFLQGRPNQNVSVQASGAGSSLVIGHTGGSNTMTFTDTAVTCSFADPVAWNSGSTWSITSAGNMTLDSSGGELFLEDQGNWGGTLSQAADRTLTQTGAGEVLNGATSLIGAINRLADTVQDDGVEQFVSYPIENAVTLAPGDCVARGASAGRVQLADADGTAEQKKFVGICRTGGTGDVGGTVVATVWTPGALCTGAGFTAGSALFVPDVPGDPTVTAPSTTGDLVQRVGWALSTTQFILDPGPSVIL